ncbi:UDP-N-acetylglucosamine 1-carboxyvinyltransferase [Corynebacterium callunae]|uniref:UDP-N-acetylglucosamine 1-carboxyvinyltransferase n=1 Tax=Corynebacterium callunae DSM 20147 TaxID=1121353 RepID=M1TN60_9CORY|nr:UDP-N-acetylglucosamine 1-carboxyvinyltransferase [Corynebacterium callunae]AGG65771.1 UDP-N-acetylglucosamine 1-carboxyvinyltransferase [Corynebacterium callunae DSM 20147]
MFALIEGGQTPRGTVKVSGAKNSATRLLAASLLTDENVYLQNFPTKLVDVNHKVNFIRSLGGNIEVNHNGQSLLINSKDLTPRDMTTDELDLPIRTTYLLAAGQLLRDRVARVPFPGGCAIGGGPAGGRGYDLHIMVWEQLGCKVTEKVDHIEVLAPKGLQGGKIDFPISTVGGTENALICAAIAHGETEIFNAYITPEVQDLIDLLRRMGAEISIFGTSRIHIKGRAGVLNGARMDVMPDRIEALTWIVYGIISGGNLTIENIPFSSMEVPLIHLQKAGVDLFTNSNSVHVTPQCLPSGVVQPFELACGTHPGVISDMQALFVLLGLKSAGISRVYDYRYPERIAFVEELAKLVDGSHLWAKRGEIKISGPVKFKSGVANSTDLRGSMAVVLAALCAEGTSRIENVHMALRGYNNLDEKLRGLGVSIEVHE